MTAKPLKEDELRELAICRCCKRKIGETPVPILWKLNAERHGLDAGALKRQQGLTDMLGGHAALARVMGPNSNMTKVLHEAKCMVCDECMIERFPELLDEES